MSDDEAIVKEFLVESYENLDRLDQDLVVLEKNPANRDTLASIFRTIHTIKGTSGFLAFNRLEALTHAGENLLARLRDGVLKLNPEITTALLAMVDAVREMLKSIEETGKEGDRQDKELIARLTTLLELKPETAATQPETSKTASTSKAEPAAGANLGEIPIRSGANLAGDAQTAVQQQHSADPRQVGEVPFDKGTVKGQDIADALNAQQQARGQNASESTIRVDVGQLDRLMNRVGELVLLRNQIVQYTNSTEDSELLGTSQRLNLLTTELQESVMKTRMQPIGNIWSKFPRTVRDVALGCGKQVRIEMEGKETELDKTIIEAIKDPLTHLVRNAVDHGIELPDVRRAAGKNPEGLLFLRAFHEGGQVNIEVTDDGAGLDYERIRNKAIQKALISADQAARMTEREVTNLIFLPGFSTAEKVSNVSGRGVGMDVVKTNIEKIGGMVDVQARPGLGSTVRMKIPLTLAIIPALIVTTAGDRYAIPQVSLLELVRLEGDQVRKGLEMVNGAPVYRLRGKLLPLVYLRKELNAEALCDTGARGRIPSNGGDVETTNIVVLRADDRQFGLVVDEINDTEEIVVKPLSKQLKSINTYAGATIMGDGKVALILDVVGLAQRAGVVNEVRDRSVMDKDDKQSIDTAGGGRRSAVLLFQRGESGRIAIDLGLVARLEEFPGDAVEIAAAQEVVQYRGEIMPLVRVSDVLGDRRSTPSETSQESLHVVVYTHNGRRIGLVVDRILDIVEEAFVMQTQTGRKGVLGSAVIQKRVTDILDVPGLIAAAASSALAALNS
ncbi:MAG TPA: chemotaxis protein CheA [Candidatus Binatia bacterium]|nr:chemotaxis protein CheA [Candidatus Sulfotelmatobacter sp.]HXJ85960.1 chemotaxis protein CheA [Candidatus Binatia bacterium]